MFREFAFCAYVFWHVQKRRGKKTLSGHVMDRAHTDSIPMGEYHMLARSINVTAMDGISVALGMTCNRTKTRYRACMANGMRVSAARKWEIVPRNGEE